MTTAEDPNFKKNLNKAYKSTSENIQNKITKMNEKDAEYSDITSWIFGDENEQEKLECKLSLVLYYIIYRLGDK